MLGNWFYPYSVHHWSQGLVSFVFAFHPCLCPYLHLAQHYSPGLFFMPRNLLSAPKFSPPPTALLILQECECVRKDAGERVGIFPFLSCLSPGLPTTSSTSFPFSPLAKPLPSLPPPPFPLKQVLDSMNSGTVFRRPGKNLCWKSYVTLFLEMTCRW